VDFLGIKAGFGWVTAGPQSLQGAPTPVWAYPQAIVPSRCTCSILDLSMGHSPFRGVLMHGLSYRS